MVEKGIRHGICHSINKYAIANNKYMKDYDKNKESSYLKYWNVNNLYGWAKSQKLPVNDFKWVEDISEFVMKEVYIFLKLISNTHKIYIIFTVIYHF